MTKYPDCVIRIPSSVSTDFFKLWLTFLKPLHNLQNRDMDILAEFLKERYVLSFKIKDVDILDSVILKAEVKERIMKRCGLKKSHLYLILRRLKSNGIIIGNKINPKFIPNIKDPEHFKLMLLFDLDKK